MCIITFIIRSYFAPVLCIVSEQSDDEHQAVTSRALVSTAVQISELRVMQEENMNMLKE